ncbi:MAG TPA: tetratricopeptide repeat protein [Sphingomicrobium sp.]|jgi:hypothetical protein
MKIALALIAAAILPAPGIAQAAKDEARPIAGAELLLRADFENAERELRAVPGAERDVARSINLGVVLAKLGRTEEAERRLQRVIIQDDVELVLANGETVGSQDAARRALGALRRGEFGR